MKSPYLRRTVKSAAGLFLVVALGLTGSRGVGRVVTCTAIQVLTGSRSPCGAGQKRRRRSRYLLGVFEVWRGGQAVPGDVGLLRISDQGEIRPVDGHAADGSETD